MNPTLPTQYAMIVGFFLPIFISFVLQRHWSTRVKTFVAFALVLLASFGTAYFEGHVDKANLLQTFFYVLTATITSFKALWQPSGIAQSIETATTLEAKEDEPTEGERL